MDMMRAMIFLGLAATLALGGCASWGNSRDVFASPSSPQTQRDSDSSADKGSSVAQGPSSTASATPGGGDAEPALDVSDKLPYKGMPAEYIDQTWLGPADEMGDRISGGKYSGGAPYYWCARNGTDDLVFAAYVKDGEVAGVAKFNLGKNYWDGGSEYPDLEASGEAADKHGSAQAAKPDPDGWDDAEDYANANSSYFKSWEEAHDYWLEEMT
ncbi:MAG: hypothetical protein Q4B45_00560 [Coriobacteriia bacterium]|nr:hypothetical protein [Coriobacteriia bacterium]